MTMKYKLLFSVGFKELATAELVIDEGFNLSDSEKHILQVRIPQALIEARQAINSSAIGIQLHVSESS